VQAFAASGCKNPKIHPEKIFPAYRQISNGRVGTSALNSLSRLMSHLRSPQSTLPSQSSRAARSSSLCIRCQQVNHLPGCGVGASMQRNESGSERYPDIMAALLGYFLYCSVGCRSHCKGRFPNPISATTDWAPSAPADIFGLVWAILPIGNSEEFFPFPRLALPNWQNGHRKIRWTASHWC
jgi:hypothetical protein